MIITKPNCLELFKPYHKLFKKGINKKEQKTSNRVCTQLISLMMCNAKCVAEQNLCSSRLIHCALLY